MAIVSWLTVAAIYFVISSFTSMAKAAENGTECGIHYEPMEILYEATAILSCNNLSGTLKWWRSSKPCGPFINYEGCSSNPCMIDVDASIGRYFYYCCTAAAALSVESAGDAGRQCYKIQVCATDAQTNSSLVVTTAFFNEPVQIYIKMIAEPPPRVTMDAFLTYSTSSQIINDMFVSVPNNGEGAEWLWQFIILVPDLSMEVERAKLMFSVNFMQENTTCSPVSVSNNNNEIPEIPVFHRTGPPPSFVTQACTTGDTDVTTQGLSSSSLSSELAKYRLATAVLGALLAIVLLAVLLIVLVTYLVFGQLKRRRNQHSLRYDAAGSSYSNGGGSTPLVSGPYGLVSQSNSTVTTPSAGTPHNASNPHPHPPNSLHLSGFPNGANTTPTDTPTPTPTATTRLLPGTPCSNTTAPASPPMATIQEEGERNESAPPVYATLNDSQNMNLAPQGDVQANEAVV